MDSTNAIFNKSVDEFHGQFDTILLDSGIVILDSFEIIPNFLWYMVVVERDDSLQAVVVLNGEDTRKDRACDANGTTLLDKIEEGVNVIEQLSDNEIGAGIHFSLKISQVIFLVGVIDMAFGMTSNGNSKVVTILLSDVFHQVNGITETTFNRSPLVLTVRRITTESENVLTTTLLGSLRQSKKI